jgi:GrpB-like predicted nucleotidyltransferase (UPF0157 family)
MTIELPTVGHLEMARSDVLALAAPATAAFLNGEQHALVRPIATADLDVHGVRLHDMLSSGDARGQSALDELIREIPETLESDCRMALLHLVLRDGSDAQVRAVLQDGLARHPGSRSRRCSSPSSRAP